MKRSTVEMESFRPSKRTKLNLTPQIPSSLALDNLRNHSRVAAHPLRPGRKSAPPTGSLSIVSYLRLSKTLNTILPCVGYGSCSLRGWSAPPKFWQERSPTKVKRAFDFARSSSFVNPCSTLNSKAYADNITNTFEPMWFITCWILNVCGKFMFSAILSYMLPFSICTVIQEDWNN